MPLRINKSQENALILAKHLKNNNLVSRVLHPALPDHTNHKIWKRDFSGSSGLFAIEMKKKYSNKKLDQFHKKLKLFELGYSWGGYENLITFPSTSDRYNKNIHKGKLIRIHCGIADIQDLKKDIDNAIKTLEK